MLTEAAVTAFQGSLDMMPRKQLSINTSAESGSVIDSCPRMTRATQFTNIIFDLGDVLFKWSPETKTYISSRTLRDILSSPTWFNYERGQLAEDECYQQIGEEFNIFPEEVQRAFDQARESLVADDGLIDS